MQQFAKFFLSALSLAIASCAPSMVQVMQLSCPSCSKLGDYPSFENDTIRVVYYFWSENGVMAFTIQNKTKIPIYIDWKKSAFVLGSTKFDYWSETTHISTASVSDRFFVGAFKWLDQTFGTATSVVTRPERVTFVPPRASISRGIFAIRKNRVLVPRHAIEEHDTTIASLNQKMTYRVARFPAEQSPISFSSFLTYSTDERFSSEQYVDNTFYLSKLVEIPEVLFMLDTNAWGSPSAFYVH